MRTVRISMHGYNGEMGWQQLRHFPPRIIHEATGILSYQIINAWQCGHDDLGVMID